MNILGKLRYTIEGDDSPIRKTLKKLKEDEAAQMRNAMKQVTDITETEKKKRKEVIAVVNQETQAIRKRNQEEANRPKRKPIISDSAAEIAAYQKGQTGTISSGTVVGQSAEYNKLANAATAASVAQERLAVTTQTAAKAATAQEINTKRLELRLESYKNISNTTFDPKIREQYNRKIQETEKQISRMSNAGKEGFDALGNKIKNSGNLVNKLWGGIRQLAYLIPGLGIAGIFSLALGPLVELISKLDLFNGKLSQAAQNLANYNEVNKNAARTAGEQIATLKILYSTATDVSIADDKRKKAALELQKVFPDSFANSKTQAILNGQEKKTYDELTASIIKNSRARAAKDKIDEIEAQRLELDDQRRKVQNANANENRRARDIETFNEVTGDVQVTKAARVREINNKRAKEALDQIAKEDKALQERENFLIKYVGKENIASAIEIKNGKQRLNTENQYQTALSKRQDILNNLQSITNEINRNDLTTDEQGRQAIKDRFADLRTQLIKYNTWAINYNKTAKKDQKVGLIPLAAVDPTEDKALGQYDAKLAVDKAKQQAEQMKQVYAQYEDYRTQYGQQAADQRFASELQGAKSYVEYLRNQMDSVVWEDTALTNGLKDFFTAELPKAEKEASQQAFDEMIKMVTNYEDQRKGIQERYDKLRAQTTNQSQIAILNENQRKEIADLDDANVQKLDAYQSLYEGVDRLSDAAARKVIADAQAMLDGLVKAGKISKQMAKDIGGKLQDASQSLTRRLPERLSGLSGELQNIAGIVGQIDDGFGKMLGTLSSVLGSVSNIYSGINSIKTAQANGDSFGGLIGGLGVIGAGMSALTTLANTLNFGQQRQQELDQATLGAIKSQNVALQQQLELIKETYGTKRLEEYNLSLSKIRESYKATEDLLATTKLTYSEDLAARVPGLRNYESMSKEQYEYVKSLLAQNAQWEGSPFYNALQELADYYEQVIDLQRQFKEEITGISLDEVTDSIVSLFDNATLSAEDFAKNFESIMKKSLMNAFKRQFLEEQLKGFYDAFYDAAESDTQLTSGEIASLQDLYNTIIGNAQKQFEQLQKISGIDLTSGGEDTSALTSNTIKAALTEDTANRALGIWNGMYDINKRMLASITEGNGIMKRHMDVSMQGLRHWAGIEVNTANTVIRLDTVVTRLDSAVTELKGINKNTGGLATRDRGV